MDYSFNRYVDFREAIDYEKLKSAQASKKSYDLLNDIRKFIQLVRDPKVLPNSIFLNSNPRYVKDKNGRDMPTDSDKVQQYLKDKINIINKHTERGEPYQIDRNLSNVHDEGHRIYGGDYVGDIIGYLQNLRPQDKDTGSDYISRSKREMEIVDGLLGRHEGADGLVQALERNIAAVEAKNPGFGRRLGMEKFRGIQKAKEDEAIAAGKPYKIQRYTPGREEELYPRPKPPEPKRGFFSRLFGK